MKPLIKVMLTLGAIFALTFILGRVLGILTVDNVKHWLELALSVDPLWVAGTIVLLLFLDLFVAVPTLTITILAGFFLGFPVSPADNGWAIGTCFDSLPFCYWSGCLRNLLASTAIVVEKMPVLYASTFPSTSESLRTMTQIPANALELSVNGHVNSNNLSDTGQTSRTLKARLAKAALLRALGSLQFGQLTVVDGGESHDFGIASPHDLQATLTVNNQSFYSQVLLGGSLGAAESYLRGDWACDDLTTLIRIFARNMEISRRLDRGLGRLTKWGARIMHKLRANTRTGARRNIHEHYDLGNDFFSQFLDETMLYSSAVFNDDRTPLVDASKTKMDLICRKLDLGPADHLLEIGTGWGGFAEHAAKHFGCRVTTTTISEEQFTYARRRIERAGLSDRVTLLLKDYRDLSGRYDKLVSIEMIEAIGHEHFDMFFGKCGELLRPDGAMLLQAITMSEQRYPQYLKSVDFIQRYIFPGGCLPSISAMSRSIASETKMRLLKIEDYSSHYAQTLRCWRRNFWDRIDAVRELGFPERFIRMWHYYFCYCEAAFSERATGVVQMLLAQPDCRIDAVKVK